MSVCLSFYMSFHISLYTCHVCPKTRQIWCNVDTRHGQCQYVLISKLNTVFKQRSGFTSLQTKAGLALQNFLVTPQSSEETPQIVFSPILNMHIQQDFKNNGTSHTKDEVSVPEGAIHHLM